MKGQAGSERKCRIRSGRETKVRKNNLTVRKSTVERMMNGEQSARVKAYVIANFHNSLIHFWSFSSDLLPKLHYTTPYTHMHTPENPFQL